MANPLKIDLDSLVPEQGEITIGGKIYTVDPPDVRTIVKLSKVAYKLENIKDETNPETILKIFDDLIEALDPVIKGLKDDDIKINIMQAGALIRFVFQMAAPPEAKALEEMGVTPVETSQKKIPPVS